MLWLCLLPDHLALDALNVEEPEGVAVVQRRGNRAWVVDAMGESIPGMDLGSAMALHRVQPIPRNPRAELEALRQLATLAHSLGSPVHIAHEEPLFFGGRPFGAVWVEIGSSLQLFGGLDRLISAAQAQMDQQSMSVRLGVAPRLEGAALAAQDGLQLQTPDALRTWLHHQPISKLRVAPDLVARLRGCGVRRIGELCALPPASVRRRFGEGLSDLLSRLLGTRSDIRRAFVLPDRYRRRFELLGVVDTTEGLLLPVRRMLVEFAQYLRARDTGAQAFSIEFLHEDRSKTRLRIELVTPARQANHFLQLARERLARTTLQSGVIEVFLKADRFAMPEVGQFDLFETAATSQREWTTLLERLTARWGARSVWSPAIVGDHRPELSWTRRTGSKVDDSATLPPRPHWLLAKPRPIPAPTRISRAERLQGRWWPAVDRDYHVAIERDGTRQWVYLDRSTQQWFLHGLWG